MTSPRLTLERFAEHIRFSNPFDDNRVTQTDSLANDVPQIHADAFDELTLRARKTSQCHDRGCGAVVTGPPGVGKSHLLARFGEWARKEKYPFIYLLNLQSGPSDILRTILKTSISILTKDLAKHPDQTRLYRLIGVTLNQALAARGIVQMVDLQTAREAYFSLVTRLDVDRDICTVLWAYFADGIQQAHGHASNGDAERAKRWLSGDSLDLDEARHLELQTSGLPEDGCSLTLEQMKQVLKVLSQFAGFRRRSFILCFDQVDTLTPEQVETWSATVHALLDTCPRLLVVTSGVDATFIEWTRHQLISQSSWDRIRQFSISLSGIDSAAAETIVANRLNSSLEPFQRLPEVAEARQRDPLFPLGASWKRQFLLDFDGEQKVDLRPRTILNQAGSVWDHEASSIGTTEIGHWIAEWPHLEQTPADHLANSEAALSELVDHRIETKIEEHRHSRLLRPEELPVDAGNVLGLLKVTLNACQNAPVEIRSSCYPRLRQMTIEVTKGRTKPAFQLVIEHGGESALESNTTVGVSVAEATSGLAATNLLKRILAALQDSEAPHTAVLIVDEREPLNLAEAGKTSLEQLQQFHQRFLLMPLDFHQYATLDACEAVAGLARSGDLEISLPSGVSRLISESEVYDSHHRHQRYLSLPVLGRLLGSVQEIGVSDSPELDHSELKKEICEHLSTQPVLTTLQLTHWWMERGSLSSPAISFEAAHAAFKSAVLELHDERKVHATAINDYYQIQPIQNSQD